MAISPVYDEYKRRVVSDFNTVAALEGIPYFLQTTGARLTELSKLLPEMRVLDVGAGVGITTALTAQIVGKRGNVVGIDIAPQMVERARTPGEVQFSTCRVRRGRCRTIDLR